MHPNVKDCGRKCWQRFTHGAKQLEHTRTQSGFPILGGNKNMHYSATKRTPLVSQEVSPQPNFTQPCNSALETPPLDTPRMALANHRNQTAPIVTPSICSQTDTSDLQRTPVPFFVARHAKTQRAFIPYPRFVPPPKKKQATLPRLVVPDKSKQDAPRSLSALPPPFSLSPIPLWSGKTRAAKPKKSALRKRALLSLRTKKICGVPVGFSSRAKGAPK